MSGLVAYGSSDEEGETPPQVATPSELEPSADHKLIQASNPPPNGISRHSNSPPAQSSTIAPGSSSPPPPNAPLAGPSARPPSLSPSLRPQPDNITTTTVPLIQSLTMPPIPNFSALPPSPTTSPPPSPIVRKFAHFAHLKKLPQPQHFHTRLASSSAANNPALFSKLMEYAGLDPDAPEQYTSSLPEEVWDPVGKLPSWAYKEELAKLNEAERRRREGERDQVEFVKGGREQGGTEERDRGGNREPKKRRI